MLTALLLCCKCGCDFKNDHENILNKFKSRNRI